MKIILKSPIHLLMQVLIRYHSDIENIIFQGSALFHAQILETFIILYVVGFNKAKPT